MLGELCDVLDVLGELYDVLGELYDVLGELYDVLGHTCICREIGLFGFQLGLFQVCQMCARAQFKFFKLVVLCDASRVGCEIFLPVLA